MGKWREPRDGEIAQTYGDDGHWIVCGCGAEFGVCINDEPSTCPGCGKQLQGYTTWRIRDKEGDAE